MADKVKVLVVGLGNMGASHASAYHRNPGFEIVGLMSRSMKSKKMSKGHPSGGKTILLPLKAQMKKTAKKLTLTIPMNGLKTTSGQMKIKNQMPTTTKTTVIGS